MLTQKQIKEIKEHLEKAQNPVFFFDNDADGLCAFLILQRYLERGKGVPVKTYPELDAGYFRKVEEFNSDYIFILDKPLISDSFWEKAEQVNIPIVWIDHHQEGQTTIPDFVNYYNPLQHKDKKKDGKFHDKRMGEPTTYLAYLVTQRKQDLWLAIIGCIGDKFIPEFYSDFKKEYPDLSIDADDAFDIYYKSGIGKIVQIFNFALKDRTTNVINMLRFLMKVKTPYEVLEEIPKNYSMHKRFNELYPRYQKYLQKAITLNKNSEKLLYFQYSGDLSISSDLSNELSYKYPNKIVLVIYLSGVKANISIRGKGARDIILKAIEGFKDATAGGHKDASGGRVGVDDLAEFKKRIEKLVN
ncbi:hypothetical protein ACFLZJ_01805 [Nanoarchaeota archaeon]